MSRDRTGPVRQRVADKARRGAELDRLIYRFPRATARAARAFDQLPPSSRVRQMLLRRAIAAGVEALNRRDLGAVFALYHPNCELEVPGSQLPGVGLQERASGRAERIRFQEIWNAEWEDFRFEPQEIVDFGEGRVLVIGRVKGTGRASGAAFDGEWAALFTISRGQVLREQAFFDHAQALEAARLRT